MPVFTGMTAKLMGTDDRLKWRCRRGLLELDLILQRFLERRFDRLSAGDKALFGELLDSPDPELLDWALGRSEPADPRYRSVVELLRAG
jgi:antitoxin CptB